MSNGTWGVWCEVWGGVTGSRCAWMKGADGAVMVFASEASAAIRAEEQAACVAGNARAQFRYTPRRLEG